MDLTLTVETGRPIGSRSARRLRREDKIPGVVYGLGEDSVAVAVPRSDLRRALTTEAGLNALINLEVEGGSQLSIVKALDRHPVRHEVTHVDFLRIDPDAELELEVPVHLEGYAEQVEREEGGVVDQNLYSLTIWAKPGSIPNEFRVDVSELTIGESIRVGSLTMPAGVRTEIDAEEPIATGSIVRVEVEEPTVDLEALEGLSEEELEVLREMAAELAAEDEEGAEGEGAQAGGGAEASAEESGEPGDG